MINLQSLLKEGKKKDAWLKYCGFIDMSLDEFQQVQERLLQEQLELLAGSILGNKLLNGSTPRSVEDFRRSVPLTTYKDYHPYFAVKDEQVLPAKPAYWVCTTGQREIYEYKWAPYPHELARTHSKNFLSSVIFSVCSKKGEFSLNEDLKFLYAMAPPPYLTGMVPYAVQEHFPFEYLPPLSVAENMSFEERNKEGFHQGLLRGIDLFFGVSSVLVRIGEKFAREEEGDVSGLRNNHPLALLRLARGLAKSKIRQRDLLPRDLWSLKGIICAGTDTAFYKERIEHYWGKKPLETYGGTEIGIAATQTWDYEGMTLFPDANFWEFIPEDEHYRSKADPGYQPKTVLVNELEPGKRYELVVTNFKGGAFVRYRVGDVIKVLDTRNKSLGIELPQIVYEDRIDDVIDLAGFTRINERTVWAALKQAGITQANWVANKTFTGGHPIVQLFLGDEAAIDRKEQKKIEDKIHQALLAVDPDYKDLQEIMAYRPLKLVSVPGQAFSLLKSEQQPGEQRQAIAPLRRINPSEQTLKTLLSGTGS